MQNFFDSWRAFIKPKVINEMLWVENSSKSKKIYDLLPNDIKNKLSQLNSYTHETFDFGFQFYDQSSVTPKLYDGKFLIPANNQLYYCDSYSNDNDLRLSSEEDKNLPTLPQNWGEYHYLASKERFGEVTQQKMVAERKIRDNKDKSKITKLCVFDFDGTLFKSPEKPDGEGNSWWLFAKSLDEPAAPHVPGKEYGYNKTVNEALKSINDPSTYCIILTGRSERFLDKRINELLLQRNLLFDEVGLNDSGEESENFKIARINEILKSLPKIQKLEMWEDQKDLADKYSEEYGDKPFKFVIHIVDDSYSNNDKSKIKIKIKLSS